MTASHLARGVISRITIFLVCGVVVLTQINLRAQGPHRIDSLQIRAFSTPPGFQHHMELEENGSAKAPTILFSDGTPNAIQGGVYALARCEDVLYGIEFVDGPGTDCRLVRINTTGFAQAIRVSTASIGHIAVEGLAAANGELYGMSVDFEKHTSSLIKINKETGVGTLVGEGSFNVIIMGFAYDPVAQKFYGAGVPFGGGADAVNEPNLYEINKTTGATTKIGDLGTTLHSLAWHPILGLIGAFHQLHQINTSTGAAVPVDANAEFAHDDNPDNGVYALASEIGEITPGSSSLKITNLAHSASTSDLIITFTSEEGKAYEIQVSNDLGFFSRLFDATGATGSDTTTVEANTAGFPARYYRIAEKP